MKTARVKSSVIVEDFLRGRDYYSGCLNHNTQRAIFGQYLGQGRIIIDRESRLIIHINPRNDNDVTIALRF